MLELFDEIIHNTDLLIATLLVGMVAAIVIFAVIAYYAIKIFMGFQKEFIVANNERKELYKSKSENDAKDVRIGSLEQRVHDLDTTVEKLETQLNKLETDLRQERQARELAEQTAQAEAEKRRKAEIEKEIYKSRAEIAEIALQRNQVFNITVNPDNQYKAIVAEDTNDDPQIQ